MQISVVCGSRANDKELLLKFLKMLDLQTYRDFDVVIVCDRNFSKEEENEFMAFFKEQKLGIINRTKFFTNNNSNFNPNHGGGASYVRNFGMKVAKGKYIQLFDDDNEVSPSFLEMCLDRWENMTHITKCECVILPSLYYRSTNQIQNQGFSKFNYWQSRPTLYLLNGKDRDQVQMFSGNGIFGLASTLRKAKYDEEIAWISEDLDYTLSLYEHGVQLRVFADLKVKHHERNKNRLEQAWIGSYNQAKQKARNWFLFLKKHGNKKQALEFYMFGLPGCLVWLSSKAIIFGGKDGFKIIGGLFAGVKEGYKLTHIKQKQ